MTVRERIDFILVVLNFATLVGASNVFGILTNNYLAPVGYSSDTAGFLGATLLLTGIVAAVITAPIFDRVLTHHLALSVKILVPCVAVSWLSLVWAVKPDDTVGLYIVMVIIGACSIPMLPVALELGCELTRNADGSSAILWFTSNLFGTIFLLIQDALRAGPTASPPLNMRNALIFNGTFMMVIGSSVFLIQGKQVRKELDEQKHQETQATNLATRIPG